MDCEPLILWQICWLLTVAAVSSGPWAPAYIRCWHPRVSEPTGPSADRTGQASRDAGQWQEVLCGSKLQDDLIAVWHLNCDLFVSHSCQKMEMLLRKITAIHQHYRKDRLTGSMYIYLLVCNVYLLLFFVMEKKAFLIFTSELAYNDEQIHKFEKWVWLHTADVLKGFTLSSPVICLSLSLPRIHLSGHIKRVKSLFREDCVQRYKEILASTRTWSRSKQALGSLFEIQIQCARLTRAVLSLIILIIYNKITICVVWQAFTQMMKA